MSTFLPPTFVSTDVEAITREMVAQFEAMSGKQLFPAQVERLLIDFIAYRENLLRIQIQKTGEQNLLAFAEGSQLDLLGDLLGVQRLGQTPAEAMIRFELVEPLAYEVLIPAGTRVQTDQGEQVFATEQSLAIPAGLASGQTTARCSIGGSRGNGLMGGVIRSLVDPIPFVARAFNISLSGGGVDLEEDASFRERIRTAPYRFSAAGPKGAYIWHARTSDPTICDVGVTSPEPGRVNIYPLTLNGPATEGVRQRVRQAVNAENVRPLTDWVEVRSPTEVPFDLELHVQVLQGSDTETVRRTVQNEVEIWIQALHRTLGRDLVPAQIVGLAQRIPGVYQAEVLHPAKRILQPNEWPHCLSLKVTITGTVEG